MRHYSLVAEAAGENPLAVAEAAADMFLRLVLFYLLRLTRSRSAQAGQQTLVQPLLMVYLHLWDCSLRWAAAVAVHPVALAVPAVPAVVVKEVVTPHREMTQGLVVLAELVSGEMAVAVAQPKLAILGLYLGTVALGYRQVSRAQ